MTTGGDDNCRPRINARINGPKTQSGTNSNKNMQPEQSGTRSRVPCVAPTTKGRNR